MKQSKKHYMKDSTAWLFIAPYLIIFIVFFLIPIIFGIYISLTNWDLFSQPEFIGFKINILFLIKILFFVKN
ncbi:hypothetical protein HMPREF2811_08590 [Globicatella sp. HMSC072A10]|nr:hypothetical protein HMPREF2811_08590 [Globicatella sp. HMSC072A10]